VIYWRPVGNSMTQNIQWVTLVVLFLFVVPALPLVLQDLKENTVSRVLLTFVVLTWWVSALATPAPEARFFAVLVVLLLGALLLALLPGRLGEADVVFVSGMAALFAFWPLIFSLALGCLAALAAYLWMFLKRPSEAMMEPIPFLPSLYWGGLTVALGGFLS